MKPALAAARALALALAAVVVVSRPAAAAAPVAGAQPSAGGRDSVVVLVVPLSPSPTLRQAALRLAGELAGAGVIPRQQPVPLRGNVRALVEATAAEGEAAAAVALTPHDAGTDVGALSRLEPAAVDIWVVDRVRRKTLVGMVRIDGQAPDRAAEIVSVRAMELLRVSFLEEALAATHASAGVDAPVPVTATALAHWAAAPLARRPWTLQSGGAVLTTPGGVPPAFLPLLRLQRNVGRATAVRLSVAGLGTRAEVETPAGPAVVTQDLGLAELLWQCDCGRFRPFAGAGLGAMRFAAEGRSLSPYDGTGGTRWALLLGAGAGVAARLGQRLELALELQTVLAAPHPAVRFLDETLAVSAYPGVLGALTVVVAL